MYIGAKPNVANFVMLDSITTSATATFNLTKDGVAYYPPNSLACIVSLNGIVQKATSSFNIVNNTIVFSQALTSNDVIDYILVMAEKIDLSIPADASVTNAKTNFVSTSSNAGLQIKGDGTTAGTLELRCENNSHGVKLRGSAHSNSPNYVLTMPPNDGNADEFLKTDGSGNLSFATAGGGKILQVVHANHSGQASTTSTSFVDLSTNTNISITPSATSSKILVMAQWNELYYNGTTSHYLRITRGGSAVMLGHNTYLPSLGGEKLLSANQIFIDSPNTTSSTEYKMQFKSQNSTAVYVNQNNATTGSSLILMEIGA